MGWLDTVEWVQRDTTSKPKVMSFESIMDLNVDEQRRMLNGEKVLISTGKSKGKSKASWFKDGYFRPKLGLFMFFDRDIKVPSGGERQLLEGFYMSFKNGDLKDHVEEWKKKNNTASEKRRVSSKAPKK